MHYRELFVFQIKPHGPVRSCLSFLPASLEQGNIFASCCQIQWACSTGEIQTLPGPGFEGGVLDHVNVYWLPALLHSHLKEMGAKEETNDFWSV